MDWRLDIALHWPHDRLAIGWEYISPTDEENISTYTLYIVICTLDFHVYH